MSSKAEITNSINTINNGGVNTALEVRTVFETLNSEFFPTVETVAGTTDNGLIYDLKIVKTGNRVLINGFIQNPFTTWITGGEIFLDDKHKCLYQFLQAEGNLNITGVPSTGLGIGTVQGNDTRRFTMTYIANND